jgi:hypothetical protein
LTYDGIGYITTHSPGFVDSSGFRWTSPSTHVTPDTSMIDKLTEVERRMNEIEYEMLRRKQMGY